MSTLLRNGKRKSQLLSDLERHVCAVFLYAMILRQNALYLDRQALLRRLEIGILLCEHGWALKRTHLSLFVSAGIQKVAASEKSMAACDNAAAGKSDKVPKWHDCRLFGHKLRTLQSALIASIVAFLFGKCAGSSGI